MICCVMIFHIAFHIAIVPSRVIAALEKNEAIGSQMLNGCRLLAGKQSILIEQSVGIFKRE